MIGLLALAAAVTMTAEERSDFSCLGAAGWGMALNSRKVPDFSFAPTIWAFYLGRLSARDPKQTWAKISADREKTITASYEERKKQLDSCTMQVSQIIDFNAGH